MRGANMIMLDAAQLQLNYGLQHSMGCWVRSLRLQDHKVNNTELLSLHHVSSICRAYLHGMQMQVRKVRWCITLNS